MANSRIPSLHRHVRHGSSYMEVQVAMVLMSLGAAGLYSMSVVQTRQTARMSTMLPADDVAAMNRVSDPWQRKLGVYAEISDTVIPDTPAQPDVAFESILDNQSPTGVTFYKSPSDTYNWYSWDHSPAYVGNAHYHRSVGIVGSHAEFQFNGVPAGEYDVYTTYPALGSLGAAIIHEIRDGGAVVATKTVNQKVAPSQLSYNGRMWDKLAFVQINSGTLSVRLNDGPGATNYILADATMVRSRRSLQVIAIAETTNGGVTATLQVVP